MRPHKSICRESDARRRGGEREWRVHESKIDFSAVAIPAGLKPEPGRFDIVKLTKSVVNRTHECPTTVYEVIVAFEVKCICH